MKKIALSLIVTLLSVCCFTSCFDNTKRVSEGYTVGIVGTNSKNYVTVLKSTIGDVYSPSIDALVANGDMYFDNCYAFVYQMDLSLPENAYDVVEANGYSTISLLNYSRIPDFRMYSYLTDTSRVLNNEIALHSAFGTIDFVEDFFFISHTIYQPSDMTVEWDLSYSPEAITPTEEYGIRNYDVFIRATKTNDGSQPKAYMEHLVAYKIDRFFKDAALNEKNSLGANYNEQSSVFTVRFNFPSEVDENNQTIRWQRTTLGFPIASFIEQ